MFAVGLLHGLGFTWTLGELALTRSEAVTALAGVNVGIEAGQLTVIAAAVTLAGRWAVQERYRHAIVVPASAAMACVAVYWTIERLPW